MNYTDEQIAQLRKDVFDILDADGVPKNHSLRDRFTGFFDTWRCDLTTVRQILKEIGL